jgi:hypothetical protein
MGCQLFVLGVWRYPNSNDKLKTINRNLLELWRIAQNSHDKPLDQVEKRIKVEQLAQRQL